MKLKYILNKEFQANKKYFLVITLVTVIAVAGYFSYALFTTTSESKGALNIVMGDLYPMIKSSDLDQDKKIVVPAGESKTFTIDLININNVSAKFNLYYQTSISEDNLEIGYLTSGGAAPGTGGIVLGASGSSTDTRSIKVKITNDSTESATITFGSDVGLEKAVLNFPTGKKALRKLDGNDIAVAYVYNEGKIDATTKCITGDETTCQETQCYERRNGTSCQIGTIVKYMVNDSTQRVFYVLEDNGEELTMIDRENITNKVSWCEDDSSIKCIYSNPGKLGPIGALKQLENSTNGWTNVQDQTYTLGTTVFKDNAFTSCLSNKCETSEFILPTRTAKARLLTVQEALSLGCKMDGLGTCPIFIFNYLGSSEEKGGTNNSSAFTNEYNPSGYNASEYWLMNNYATVENAYTIHTGGSNDADIMPDAMTNTHTGVRAVIVINKQ